MNKNFSLILNVVLFVAVAVLYYLHFSGSHSAQSVSITKDSVINEKPIVMSPTEIKASKIVYVNLDELNEKYDYLKDISNAAKSEQQALESQYQSKAQKLQDDYNAFQESVQKGLLSDNQAKAKQEELMNRKAEVDQIEARSQALMEKIQAKNDEANNNLRNYINEYNKKSNYSYVLAYSKSPLSQILLVNDSLDITKDILDGLNNQYKASKKK